jgi:hypothetical protein
MKSATAVALFQYVYAAKLRELGGLAIDPSNSPPYW